MSAFPVTSITLIKKLKDQSSEDGAAWVRFWDTYQGAIRQFAAHKGGEANADDIVMTVLGKLVEVFREGRYVPEKGHFRSYLATMIANEVYMLHRKDVVRKVDRHVSLDEPIGGCEGKTVSDVIEAGVGSVDSLDEDWRMAILASAREHVLNRSALSERDRLVYRAYVMEGKDAARVARDFGITRNYVSQIKTRIEKRIVAVGREMLEQSNEL